MCVCFKGYLAGAKVLVCCDSKCARVKFSPNQLVFIALLVSTCFTGAGYALSWLAATEYDTFAIDNIITPQQARALADSPSLALDCPMAVKYAKRGIDRATGAVDPKATRSVTLQVRAHTTARGSLVNRFDNACFSQQSMFNDVSVYFYDVYCLALHCIALISFLMRIFIFVLFFLFSSSQGSLDPGAFFGTDDVIATVTEKMVRAFGPSRYIANLGHGMLPTHEPRAVAAFADAVHKVSQEMVSKL